MISYAQGDYRVLLQLMAKRPEPQRARATVSSVPYWGNRDYGHDGWGRPGESLEEWVAEASEFAERLWAASRDDAWAAINVGDSWVGSGGAGGDYQQGGGYEGRGRPRQGPAPGRLKQSLAGTPWLLAMAFEANGWKIRQEIVWAKDVKPESAVHVKRPRSQHEKIFLLAKGSPPYHHDREHRPGNVWNFARARLPRIEPKPKAPWPPRLVAALIDPLTTEGEIVLDPFAGCGITPLVADAMGRSAEASDIDPDAIASYYALFDHREWLGRNLSDGIPS